MTGEEQHIEAMTAITRRQPKDLNTGAIGRLAVVALMHTTEGRSEEFTHKRTLLQNWIKMDGDLHPAMQFHLLAESMARLCYSFVIGRRSTDLEIPTPEEASEMADFAVSMLLTELASLFTTITKSKGLDTRPGLDAFKEGVNHKPTASLEDAEKLIEDLLNGRRT